MSTAELKDKKRSTNIPEALPLPKAYQEEYLSENKRRLLLGCVAVLLVSTGYALRHILFPFTTPGSLIYRLYLVNFAYGILLAASGFFIFSTMLSNKSLRFHTNIQTLYAFLILIWASSLTALDLQVSQNIASYLIANLIIAMALSLPPASRLPLFFTGLIIILSAASFSTIPMDFPQLLSFIFIALIGWIISGFIEKTKKQVFIYHHLLKQKNNELYNRNLKDALTGAYNRKYIMEVLKKSIKTLNRDLRQHALLLVDIDDFTKLNKDFGSMIGDGVLKTSAKIIAQTLRETDFIARYEGAVFLIFLPECDAKGAAITAERLVTQVGTYSFQEISRQITVSIGVTMVSFNDSPDKLLERADIELQRAKDAGKNCWMGQLGELPQEAG
jgi:diguanylate cyclase (GGDEF)-like protein